ncbi:hypothetical protein Bealeia1_00235 [Candidatus Bealeia paramacronuclearis]|uniref:Uncharacterized protein n=1 Tax=Candidatus Bealeia paramacronuclearis TaxID=1921001 RepID=A0ABZ2C0L9_9PROT|nr:hypothetical protein [Candidatus Bealeia paramacronuclearis]
MKKIILVKSIFLLMLMGWECGLNAKVNVNQSKVKGFPCLPGVHAQPIKISCQSDGTYPDTVSLTYYPNDNLPWCVTQKCVCPSIEYPDNQVSYICDENPRCTNGQSVDVEGCRWDVGRKR